MTDEELFARIAEISPEWAEEVGGSPMVFSRTPVAFYRSFQLLTVMVSNPPNDSQLRFADDGAHLIALPSNAEAIYEINRLDGLELTEGFVPAYVRFFFENLVEPSIQIVESADEIDWYPQNEMDDDLEGLKQEAASQIRQMEVVPIEAGFEVKATGIHNAQLEAVELVVTREGNVDVKSRTTLIDFVPVVEEFLF